MLLSEKFRKFALACEDSRSRIARESRIGYGVLKKFLDGEAGIHIETVDKLAEFLKLELVEKKSSRRRKGDTISEQLKAYLEDCKDSYYQIAQDTNVERVTIRRFLRGERGIELKTADRLAKYLSLDLRKKK